MPPREYYLPERQLVQQSEAALIEPPRIPRSKFTNRSYYLSAFNAGKLIPFLVNEILPGDHMRYNVTAYLRMATALFPIFSNFVIQTFFFFVPYRILWTDFVKFMGEQTDPSSDISGFTIPTVGSPAGGHAVGSIYDYMGIPVAGQITGGNANTVSALPFRAYNRIWNTWFRDENMQNHVNDNTGNGPDNNGDYGLFEVAKFHDYFTSALPFAQKFTAPVTPLSGTAPVIGLGAQPNVQGTVNVAANFRETPGITTSYANYYDVGPAIAAQIGLRAAGANGDPMLFADLTLATGVSINQIRQSMLIQQMLERDARGGTRYNELVLAQFGVQVPDSRVQRPEYIGGGKTHLQITPVAQTTPTGGGGLGSLGATGTGAGEHSASYAATEHGVILGLIAVRAEQAYQQGVHRMWTRKTRFDMPWPALSQLGEQAIPRKEIYQIGDEAGANTDNTTFGFQERYQELRTMYSQVTGLMRSTAAGTIDLMHTAQKFTTPPVLGTTFIKDTPPMDRILAAGSAENNKQFLANIEITREAVRPIPAYGTPAILGHF